MVRSTTFGNIRHSSAFTLIELLLVMLLIALLASVVTPTVVNSIHHAKESALKENLKVMREAVDDYYTDNGHYPPSFDELVERRYIRKLPVDPMMDDSPEWTLAYHDDGETRGIINLHSQSSTISSEGSPYNTW